MKKPDRKMIQDGKAMIRQGLEILQKYVIKASESLRSDLTEFQPEDLSKELLAELHLLQVALSKILPATRATGKRAPKTSTAKKVAWIAKELGDNKGEMPKADLVRSYSNAFRCKPSPMILDLALGDKQFKTVRAGRAVQVSLAVKTANKKGVIVQSRT